MPPNEFALLVAFMREPRQFRPQPMLPPAVVQHIALDSPQRRLNADEREALRQAFHRVKECGTGRLALDAASGLQVPELRPGCEVAAK